MSRCRSRRPVLFFSATANTKIYTLSLHDALPILVAHSIVKNNRKQWIAAAGSLLRPRSEEHTSELQSLRHLVCRLLLEKKKISCCARGSPENMGRNRPDARGCAGPG